MRLLIVAEPDLRTTGSGAERTVASHVAGFVERGHSIVVLCGGRGAPTRAPGMTVIRLGWSPLTPWRVRRAVARLLARERFDAIIVYHGYPAAGLLGLAERAGAAVAYVVLSPWDEEYAARHPDGHGPLHAGRRAVRRAIERRTLRAAQRVLPMSRFMAGRVRAIHALPDDVIRVVPGGVDRDRFRPPVDRAAARRRLGLPGAAPVLLVLRNLEPRMGLEALLRAMPRVLAVHAEAVLVVAGTGPLAGSLRALAAELGMAGQVRFPGFVPEEDLPSLYGAADLFVLPTEALEGFGLVTLEALACGTPVLGSRVGATPELLEPLDPALLLADTSPAAIADGILRFLARPDRERLARRCRAHTEAYAWDRVLDLLERELTEAKALRARAV